MRKSILILTLIIGVVNFNFAQTEKKISVEGIARIKEKPELIVLSANLLIRAQDYNVCFQKALTTLNELKSEFIKNGIKEDEIKSNEIVVSELYDWNGLEKNSNGYFSRIEFEIEEKFSPEFSERLLKSLDTKELNLSYSIKFEFSETQKEKIRKIALAKAIEDAKIKASIIAQETNLSLGEIVNIQYSAENNNFGYLDENQIEVAEEVIPINQPNSRFGEIDFNPKEKSISKVILIEWKYQVNE